MLPINQPAFKLSHFLLQHHLMLATAESCTGGMVASALTDLAGSSVWFERGFITYSNASKCDHLGLSMDLITTHGAVSIPVAKAMAIGALTHSKAQVALSITGVAGPTGGSPEKPVGFVCFGWAWNQNNQIHSHSEGIALLEANAVIDDSTRNNVRVLARDYALVSLLGLLTQQFN